jgi:NAD-dependent deacetylase
MPDVDGAKLVGKLLDKPFGGKIGGANGHRGQHLTPQASHATLGASRYICQTRGMPIDQEIADLAQAIARSRRAVVFTGAGISTESGIPDFRSPGGIWTRMAPIDFADFLASEEARRETWRRRFAMDETFRSAMPNRGHRTVAELVRRGKVAAVITQNIDGLHQASGIAEDQVVELHGNSTYAQCLDCKTRYELEAVRASFDRDETAPLCEECGGFVKTATISFGQAMPVDAMRRAEIETRAADLFIVAGSSLVVYPAAGFPELATRNGASLVIINREPTGLDPIADLVLNRAIGETLGAAVGVD